MIVILAYFIGMLNLQRWIQLNSTLTRLSLDANHLTLDGLRWVSSECSLS